MQKRFDIINYLIAKNNYKTYLEIGVRKPSSCFNKIKIETKVAVDPNFKFLPKGEGVTAFEGTSDEFFNQNKEKFDIIFIDGLHVFKQVDKDISNSLKALEKNGSILMHDCNPAEEWHQRELEEYNGIGTWNGTTWKAFVKHRSNPNLEMMTIDTDYGVGYIKEGSQEPLNVPVSNMTWFNFDINRKDWINLKTVKQFTNAVEVS